MRHLTGVWKLIASIIAGIWVIFIGYTALTVAFHPLLQDGISLILGLSLVFLLYPLNKRKITSPGSPWKTKFLYGTSHSPSLLDIVLLVLAIIPCLYIIIAWEHVARAVGRFETYQLALALILACLLIEGIWGLLTDYTSRVIAVFLIFGPVLFATGVGQAFMKIAQAKGGRVTRGVGQISVVSSGLFGMISGSSAANVAVDGHLTIPTMKKLGYKSELAGAIEATASSGGQIMPPVMGAGAFIMAEFLNIPFR